MIFKELAESDSLDIITQPGMYLFLGDIIDKSDKNFCSKREKLLSKLLTISSICGESKLSIDTDLKKDKEYILLSRKRQYYTIKIAFT